MKWTIIAAAIAAIAFLAFRWNRNRDNSPEAATQAVAGIVVSMQHAVELRAELRGKPLDQVTEDQRDLLRITLHDLAVGRAGLAGRLSDLDPKSRRTKNLRSFLDRWSTDGSLEHGLIDQRNTTLDADLKSLAADFPEDNWRTLFPLFRP
jgi:hypothetical protein